MDNIKDSQIVQAVEALQKYCLNCKKKDLVSPLEKIFVQITMKLGVVNKPRVLKYLLPHPVVSNLSDVCVFVKDLDAKSREYEPTIDSVKDIFKEKNIDEFPSVMPLKQLSMEFKPHEAKRNLANMHDGFFVDRRIAFRINELLGKHFYSRKRFPVPINMQATDLKAELLKAKCFSMISFKGRSPFISLCVGSSELTLIQLVENIRAALTQLASTVIGGFSNIRNVIVKSNTSPALRLYTSLDAADVSLPEAEKPLLDEPEEISTVSGKVRIKPSGFVEVIRDNSEVTSKEVTKTKNIKRLRKSTQHWSDLNKVKKCKRITGNKQKQRTMNEAKTKRFK